MKQIYENKADQLKIFSDGTRYFGEYVVWRMPIHEERLEVAQDAVESYIRGEHTGEEFIHYLHFGVWAPKLDQWHSTRKFLQENPDFLLINPEASRQYFSDEEFSELMKIAKSMKTDD